MQRDREGVAPVLLVGIPASLPLGAQILQITGGVVVERCKAVPDGAVRCSGASCVECCSNGDIINILIEAMLDISERAGCAGNHHGSTEVWR